MSSRRVLCGLLLLPGAAGAEPDLTLPPPLQGTWALELRVTTSAEAPVLGQVRSEARTWVRAVVHGEGLALRQEHQLCGAEVKATLGGTRLPASYLAAAPSRSYGISLLPDSTGWRFDADTLPFRMGFDPACATVPSTPDDPCVRDSDHDGHPGATLQATAPLFPWVDVYVAQRNHPVLHGRVVSNDRIEGRVEMKEMTTRVLGSTHRLFDRSPTAVVVPGASRFTMQRLPDGATCVDVRAHFAARDLR